MINLLPTDLKQDITFARRNTYLVRWVVALVFALLGSGLIIGYGNWYLQNANATYSKQVEQAQAELKAQQLTETQDRLEEISGNLKLVVQVLEREVQFSELLQQLGASIPAGVSLSELQIEQVSGGLTIRANAESFEKATQLQLNLADPNNKIFEKADLENIQCGQASEETTYDCTVQIRALFSPGSTFYFLNSTAEKNR